METLVRNGLSDSGQQFLRKQTNRRVCSDRLHISLIILIEFRRIN